MIEKANMTVKEFWEYMGIGRVLAYKICSDSSFYPAIRLGKKILINRRLLEKWIDEQGAQK